MATAFPEDSSLQHIFECPVCLEDFKDPRILVCGHHFCQVCLEGIASRYTTLTCPACRCETQLGPGKQVADLPRPVLVNELQIKMASLLEGDQNKTTRYCDPCGRKKVTAVSHCHQCKKKFCGNCEANHKKPKVFKSHSTELLSNLIFCDSHLDEFVTIFCKDCKTCFCVNCIMGEHSDHKMEDISVVAQGSRGRLEEYVSQGALTFDKAEVKEASKQVSQTEKLQSQFRDSISQLRGLIQKFQQKIDSLETEIETKLSEEIQNMKQYTSDLDYVVSTTASLLDYAKNLLEKSPETELVMKELEFQSSADSISVLSPYTTTLPVFEATFNTLCAGMKGLIDSCHITYKSHALGKDHTVRPSKRRDVRLSPSQPSHAPGRGSPVTTRGDSPLPTPSYTWHVLGKGAATTTSKASDVSPLAEPFYPINIPGGASPVTTRDTSPLAGLTETHSFDVGCEIWGLVADTQRQCLIVRTNDRSSPIQVYDYNGRLREKLGGDIQGLADCNPIIFLWTRATCTCISLDTKRSLYLCPVQGALVLIDRAGKVTATVKVGSKPRGISYSEDDDVYVVSDCGTHKVYVIDANSHQIVTEFGGEGFGDDEFSSPHTVHVCHVSGISQTVIVVSDWYNHRVKLHDMTGAHIKTFGSKGQGDRQLQSPCGVTTDPAGRIVTCDHGNNRVVSCWVVSCWVENNRDKWCCLLDSTKLSQWKPCHISYNPHTRALAIGYENGLIQVFK